LPKFDEKLERRSERSSIVSDWYDRQGNKLPYETDKDRLAIEKLLTDKGYKIVKQEMTPDGRYWVSTVWLGLDHSWSGGTPIIFETMVFSGKKDRWYELGGKRVYTRNDHEQIRYCTEEQAIKGHERLLKQYSQKEKK
jgi:hypothetical protein